MAHILVVEDEEKLARFVELELIHEGNTVDKAEDGRSGLDMALSNDYDLILLDVMLPGINGFEVLRRVRVKKETPVIVVDFHAEATAEKICFAKYCSNPHSSSEMPMYKGRIAVYV